MIGPLGRVEIYAYGEPVDLRKHRYLNYLPCLHALSVDGTNCSIEVNAQRLKSQNLTGQASEQPPHSCQQ